MGFLHTPTPTHTSLSSWKLPPPQSPWPPPPAPTSDGFNYHLKADNSQISSPSLDLSPSLQSQISCCLQNISTWVSHHLLKLNMSEAELIISPAPTSLLSLTLAPCPRLQALQFPDGTTAAHHLEPGQDSILSPHSCVDEDDDNTVASVGLAPGLFQKFGFTIHSAVEYAWPLLHYRHEGNSKSWSPLSTWADPVPHDSKL